MSILKDPLKGWLENFFGDFRGIFQNKGYICGVCLTSQSSKKMKKVLLTLVMVAAASMWSAQAGNNLPFIKFGIKAGITSDQKKVETEHLGDLFKNSSTGYHVGAMVRVDVPLLPLYVQPEVIYTMNKFGEEGITASVNSLDVPVLVGAGIGLGTTAKVRVNAGPVFNVNTSSKVDAGALELEGGDDLFKKSMGWTAGAGVDLFGVTVDFRYNGQFKDNEGDFAGVKESIKSNSWSVSVGFLF